MILSLSAFPLYFFFISSFPILQLSPIVVLYRAPLLPSHVHRASPPSPPAPLRPTSLLSCPSSSSAPSSSLDSLPRLSVSLPSFLRPSSFHLLPPFSPLSFPPLPFLPSPCPSFSLRLSAGPFVPFPPPHFIENVWYAGAFYTGTEPPPLAGLMAGMEQSGRLSVRTFVSARDGPRRDVAFNLQPRF